MKMKRILVPGAPPPTTGNNGSVRNNRASLVLLILQGQLRARQMQHLSSGFMISFLPIISYKKCFCTNQQREHQICSSYEDHRVLMNERCFEFLRPHVFPTFWIKQCIYVSPIGSDEIMLGQRFMLKGTKKTLCPLTDCKFRCLWTPKELQSL